jgi:hypothetical protein
MRLIETLDDARMRRRVRRLTPQAMHDWMVTTLNGLHGAWREYEKSGADAALDEIHAGLRAAAALHAGLSGRKPRS